VQGLQARSSPFSVLLQGTLLLPFLPPKKGINFWLTEEILCPLPNRQYVFTVPKMLRPHFRFDRKLLGKLSQCAYQRPTFTSCRRQFPLCHAALDCFANSSIRKLQNSQTVCLTLGINKGRAFYTRPDRLGEYLLVDYLSHQRKKV